MKLCRPWGLRGYGQWQQSCKWPWLATQTTPGSSQKRDLHEVREFEKPQRRSLPNPATKNVAVLGGGITGLASAFFLTQELPNVKVTLIEQGHRLGGWLDSSIKKLDNGHVVFENGPRTLRHDLWGGHFTRDLISKLNLDDELVTISKNAPASLNRYIYYPDHLVRMPGPFPNTGLISNIVQNANILCEPAFDSFLSGVFRARAQRGAKVLDQSVGTFLSRLFNKSITDNLASAVIHGIYAGDLYNLSARSLFPVLWDIDGNDSFNRDLYRYGSGSRSYRPKPLVELLSFLWDRSSSFDQHIRGKVPKLDNTSVFTFKRGIQQLATALEDYLRAQSRVTLKLGTTVTKLAGSRSHLDKISVSTAPNTTSTEPSSTSVRAYDYVISTLSAPTMSRVLEFSHPSASKAFSAHDQAVNVMVVNLFYPQPDLLPVSGFGYLIPRSTPLGQNGECALGVIFGTDSSPGQDTAPGTKLTVMMGGHWWNGIPISDLPDPHEATKMARAILERHLNITAEPIIAEARLQTNAIPQYRVGHPFRLLQIERSLNSTTTMSPTAPPSGRLRLAGSWYSGVGVNDCITSARMAVEGIRQGHLDRAMDLYLHGTHPLSWILEERRGGESKFYERVPISST